MPPLGTIDVKGAVVKANDPTVYHFMEMFWYAYNESIQEFQRLEDLQRIYDNTVNESSWPTTSKIPIPLHFTMIEKVLPTIIDYLFPTSKFIRLTPLDNGVDMDSVRKVEWALQHTVVNRMRLQQNAYATIKDCFKLGIGYGIVEPIMITPPTTFTNMLFEGENEVTRSRVLSLGSPKQTIRYRYVSPGQIIVTPDGNDFNGRNRVSVSFFIDSYNEDVFRKMYESAPTDGEKPILKDDPEAIIQQARSLGFDSRVPIVNVVAALGGIDIQRTNKNHQEAIPVQVPVLKIFIENRHVWIANGTTIIFDEEDRFQTLRTPLVKCSAWPDSMRWYPMSTAEASSRMTLGVNVWVNALFDLMTHHLKPEIVYDKNKLPRGPERGPNSEIGVAGDVRNSIDYVRPPDVPQALFQVGDILERWYGSAVGQEQFLQEGSPGLLRGGAFSFESLLQTSSGRDRLAGAILETNWLEPIILQTLIYMQLNIGPEGDIFKLREFDQKTGEEYIEDMRITEADLVNAYELDLNLKAKHRNATIDQNARLAEFNIFKDDEYIDQYELRVRTIPDESETKRLVLPRDVVRRRQEINRLLSLDERRAGIQEAQVSQPSATTEQQALAGAARVGGA